MSEQRQHLDTQEGSRFPAKPKSVFRKMIWKVFSDMLLKRKVSLYNKGLCHSCEVDPVVKPNI